MASKRLTLDYYQQDDVLSLSRDLLGKMLFTRIGGVTTGGMIIETEAYRGPEDRASHAYGNKRTKRNEVMYHSGGVGYVYLCYGLHALFNVVTNQEDIPHAILIRALAPREGIDIMAERRQMDANGKTLTSGPGSLSQALGITVMHNGISLIEDTIWIEDHGILVSPNSISTGPRIGVDYAGEDAKLPWRYRLIETR